mmetsp:Transcript_42887/g.100642  ORF Transcript_42887/g.100642 Transcript_42887/m.100642 type:complete len:226 (-) Transcript_42887:362-1039(-)
MSSAHLVCILHNEVVRQRWELPWSCKPGQDLLGRALLLSRTVVIGICCNEILELLDCLVLRMLLRQMALKQGVLTPRVVHRDVVAHIVKHDDWLAATGRAQRHDIIPCAVVGVDLIVVLDREATISVPREHWQHVNALQGAARVILLKEGFEASQRHLLSGLVLERVCIRNERGIIATHSLLAFLCDFQPLLAANLEMVSHHLLHQADGSLHIRLIINLLTYLTY